MIPLARAISERIRGGLRWCALQTDVYFTLLTFLIDLLYSIDYKKTDFYFAGGSGYKILWWVRLCVFLCVCLSACPRGYLRNNTRGLYLTFYACCLLSIWTSIWVFEYLKPLIYFSFDASAHKNQEAATGLKLWRYPIFFFYFYFSFTRDWNAAKCINVPGSSRLHWMVSKAGFDALAADYWVTQTMKNDESLLLSVARSTKSCLFNGLLHRKLLTKLSRVRLVCIKYFVSYRSFQLISFSFVGRFASFGDWLVQCAD